MEVMSYVDVSHRADEVMCIGRMLKLTKLGIVVTGKEASYLMKYVFQGGESSSYNLADSYMLSPPRLLQTLSISGLHQLVKITLRETYLTGDALYVLGNLRSLRCLRFLPKALAEARRDHQIQRRRIQQSRPSFLPRRLHHLSHI